MKTEIITQSDRKKAIQNTLVFLITLVGCIAFGLFDLRSYDDEQWFHKLTGLYWFGRVGAVLLIPFLLYTIFVNCKRIFVQEIFLRISENEIYMNYFKSNKREKHILYEDITDITFKDYNDGVFAIFLHLKNPAKYIDQKQLDKIMQARQKDDRLGHLAIPSTMLDASKDDVIQLIRFYMDKANAK